MKLRLSNLPKYIDRRDCAQQKALVGGIVEMIQGGGREQISSRSLENMVSWRHRVSQEL